MPGNGPDRDPGRDDGSAGPAAPASWPGPASDGDTAPLQAVARTPTGWRVGDEELPDLTSAMVLADILNAELTADEQAELDAAAASSAPPARPDDTGGRNVGLMAGPPAPGVRGQDPAGAPAGHRAARGGAHRAGPSTAELAEAEQLKETVAQLERALTVRVRVEQAIGILAERHRIRPRQAFELLRSASRARGQRIMETASQVIASATNPLLRLPEELAKPPMPRRMPRRSRGEA
ncbi:MAG: ANTAR domain-containing protein [Streptosporangiaceae bacterium]